MRVEANLLDEPASEGARLVLRRLLEAALEKLAPLEKRSDPEALHDLRVALRRLRSLMRSLKGALSGGTLRGKHRRALRQLAATTNEPRDAEVQLAWLAAHRGRLPRKDLPAVKWLAARLDARRRAGYALATEKLAGRFRRLAGELERGLARASARGRAERRAAFGVLMGELLRTQLRELLEALDAVRAPSDVEPIHAARIEAKRLRYLLEPLRGNERADADPAVAIVKELQEVLGELHDAHVLGDALGVALLDVATERARRLHAAARAGAGRSPRGRPRDDLTPGLLDLDVRVMKRVSTAYSALAHDWLPARRSVLAGRVTAVVDALSRPARFRRGVPRRGQLRDGAVKLP